MFLCWISVDNSFKLPVLTQILRQIFLVLGLHYPFYRTYNVFQPVFIPNFHSIQILVIGFKFHFESLLMSLHYDFYVLYVFSCFSLLSFTWNLIHNPHGFSFIQSYCGLMSSAIFFCWSLNFNRQLIQII